MRGGRMGSWGMGDYAFQRAYQNEDDRCCNK
jgi:hypothetical protein